MRIPAALCLFVLMCSEGAYAQAVAGFGAITGKVRDIYGDGIRIQPLPSPTGRLDCGWF